MKAYDREMKFLHCKGCGETRPLFSNSFRNPELFVIKTLDPWLKEHADCEKFKDVKRAAAALRWKRVIAGETSGRKRNRRRYRIGR